MLVMCDVATATRKTKRHDNSQSVRKSGGAAGDSIVQRDFSAAVEITHVRTPSGDQCAWINVVTRQEIVYTFF